MGIASATFGLLVATAAWAGEPAGITIRQVKPGVVAIDAQDTVVSIHKQLQPGRSETTFSGMGERLTIVIEPTGVSIVRPGGTVRLSDLDEAGAAREKARLDASRALAAARRFLAETTLDAATLSGRSLLLTRALLGVFAGDGAAVNAYRRLVQIAPGTPGLRPAAFQRAEGPGACWDIYVKYSIKIWDELTACKKDLHWYNVLSAWACDALYVEQAELSMAWLVACDGGMPVR